MAVWEKNPMLVMIPLWMNIGTVATGVLIGHRYSALSEPEICYVLDGILFLYSIILTALYCRIKIQKAKEARPGKMKPTAEESIYTGLTPHPQDTYETIGLKK